MTGTRGCTARDPIRVFLLDDHEVVRRGLSDLLDSEDGLRAGRVLVRAGGRRVEPGLRRGCSCRAVPVVPSTMG